MARLPFSPNQLESRELDLRGNARLPVSFSHPVRDIDERMEDVVYNAIDVIQDRARDNGLRTFYYNMMSDNDYRNRDFEDIIGIIADMIDIGVSQGNFREVRDAIIPIVEEVIGFHIGYQVDRFPELIEFVSRDRERDIDKAIAQFRKYRDAVETYRRNGNRLPSGRRDDYRDRDRGRDGPRYGDERRGGRDDRPSRRDNWDRGALRGGVQGSPRRDNRFGNTNQDDRFDEPGENNTNDQNRNNNDRPSRQDDRYEDMPPSRLTRRDEPRSTIQRLPGQTRERDADIEDALASEQGSSTMTQQNTVSENNNPLLMAFNNQDAWVPSKEYPHPLAFNHTQDLYYEMDVANSKIIPRVVNKDQIVNYYDHDSMAFGKAPKDFDRFEADGIGNRLNQLHDALVNPTNEIAVEGQEDKLVYHKRLDVGELDLSFYSMKEALLQMNYRRTSVEGKQVVGDVRHAVEMITGSTILLDPIVTTDEENGMLEELRGITSFSKMSEMTRKLAKRVRPEVFLQLDRHLTKAVNHMLRQYMSIPHLKVGSFSDDWLELFGIITNDYGEAYRDAINMNQERELKFVMGHNSLAETVVLNGMSNAQIEGVRPFVLAMPTKVIYLREVSYNLDLDMVPDVASQLLPEANPFFHDLAQDLLTKKGNEYGRFFIQTADLRVIEASRSFLNDKAILLRVVNNA